MVLLTVGGNLTFLHCSHSSDFLQIHIWKTYKSKEGKSQLALFANSCSKSNNGREVSYCLPNIWISLLVQAVPWNQFLLSSFLAFCFKRKHQKEEKILFPWIFSANWQTWQNHIFSDRNRHNLRYSVFGNEPKGLGRVADPEAKSKDQEWRLIFYIEDDIGFIIFILCQCSFSTCMFV